MKKLLLSLLITGMVSGAALAQDQQKHKEDKAAWDQKVKTELALSAEQSTKYDDLSKEYGDKIEAIMTDASLSKDAQKEKKMALKKEKETKLFEFITPEQQTKYKALVEKKKAEKVTNSDLKGKKVDADLSQEEDQPLDRPGNEKKG